MNILVTGVSRGVGLEIATVLLKEGHNVFGISRSTTEEVKALVGLYPDTFVFRSFDLADTSAVRVQLFRDFINNGIPLDGFVNNAAMAYDDIISNLDIGRLELMFKTNVYSPMLIVKYVIRNMLFNKKRGSIVHISSISVHTGYKGLAMYAASKGAIEAFSKNTSREWGELGIRSNSIVAGFMETDMSSTLSADQKKRIYSRTALKRSTDVTSVAETVSFLLSDKSSSITGENIFVTSGTI